MGKIPILSREEFRSDRESRNCSGSHLTESSLPVPHMSDVALMGILVDDLPLALRTLERGNITLFGVTHDLEFFTLRALRPA
jgi:hypothetical protein